MPTTQGVALGYAVPAFQAEERKRPITARDDFNTANREQKTGYEPSKENCTRILPRQRIGELSM
jgi:hypothetical protein